MLADVGLYCVCEGDSDVADGDKAPKAALANVIASARHGKDADLRDLVFFVPTSS